MLRDSPSEGGYSEIGYEKGYSVTASAFLAFVRGFAARIFEEHGDAFNFCSRLANSVPESKTAARALALLPEMRDDRDYAISSAYALLIGKERRKRLSAYFTPPTLADAAVNAATVFLSGQGTPRALDPACGGGSFLGPMLRSLVERERKAGHSTEDACQRVLGGLRGIEIDPGLARLSSLLLRERLRLDYGYTQPDHTEVVVQGDSLGIVLNEKFDLVVGNPPYGKLGRSADSAKLTQAGLAGIGGHTNVYGLFLLRALDWLKPGGGLVFVLPTSFVAGPYFSGLRQEVLARSEVVSIDLHELRENLFVGAVQDVCLLALRRRASVLRPGYLEEPYELGVIDAAGERQPLGTAIAVSGGEPWTLPVPGKAKPNSTRTKNQGTISTVADYGYRIRVGKVVPTRERERLLQRPIKGSVPLVWASNVRPDGTFHFADAQRKTAAWYLPPSSELPYATRVPCVLVQRTSNRDQRRRLNAAAITADFLRMCGKRGFVAENHVIVLEVMSDRPPVSPEALATILNAAPTNERFSGVSGTFSVSAQLLGRLALPDPALLPEIDAPTFDQDLRSAFDTVHALLAPLKLSCNAKDSLNQSRDLSGSSTINQDTGLKGCAVA